MKFTLCSSWMLDAFNFQSRRINIRCNNIICSVDSTNDNIRLVKRQKMYCTPAINETETEIIKSVVGLHITHKNVSWARIETEDNCLTHWKHVKLPEDASKLDVVSLCSIAFKLKKMLPIADRYVLESVAKSGISSQQMALQAMRNNFATSVVTLLNVTPDSEDMKRNVVLLKARIPARLFNLLVGQEQIACEAATRAILSGDSLNHCTPLTTQPGIASSFYSGDPTDKETLGLALLLTISFNELMLYKNMKFLTSLMKPSSSNLQKQSPPTPSIRIPCL